MTWATKCFSKTFFLKELAVYTGRFEGNRSSKVCLNSTAISTRAESRQKPVWTKGDHVKLFCTEDTWAEP
jgi:hypothetical protein